MRHIGDDLEAATLEFLRHLIATGAFLKLEDLNTAAKLEKRLSGKMEIAA